MTSLPKSILQEAIQGKLVTQIPEEGTAQVLLDQIQTEKKRRQRIKSDLASMLVHQKNRRSKPYLQTCR